MDNILLKVTNVSGKKGKFRLKDISFEIMSGYMYGLMGENGAGKSTLMNYIVSDECKYTGEMLLDGEVLHLNHAQLMNKIGFVSEDRKFFNDLSGRENADILGALYDNYDKSKFEEMMTQLGASENKKYSAMSRGEKLKFQLAFEIAHAPKLYILDEVTVGMDPVFRKELFSVLHKLIESEEVAILMTSHIESEMKKHVDYIAIMKDGRLDSFKESIDA